MPEMGGGSSAQRLALLEPGLPILFMSGYTGEDVVQRGLLDPGAPFQQKPFTPALWPPRSGRCWISVPRQRQLLGLPLKPSGNRVGFGLRSGGAEFQVLCPQGHKPTRRR